MAKRGKKQDLIRVGVVGVGRGVSFAQSSSEAIGLKLVALCDLWEEKLLQVGKKYNVATYTDYSKFLEHDLDAVVLANYFHQHAPLAIQALRAGKHVMSETAACATLAEGVQLCREVEKSKRIYMFAENYPYGLALQEMRRLYQAGEIGPVRYAEGEYNHAMNEGGRLRLSPGLKHWRNWLPPTYYTTHALAPLMHITDTLPLRVSAMAMSEESTQSPRTTRVADMGCAMLVRMDSGAVFRIWGLMQSSIHRIRYELHGERGMMGTVEPNSWTTLRVHHEKWLTRGKEVRSKVYIPNWPSHAELAEKTGHGGGDLWTSLHFANAIRSGEQPYLDVYRGVAMTLVGIIGWRSALAEGQPMAIPDFRQESVRRKHANDHGSPYPDGTGDGKMPPSIRGLVPPSRKAVAAARKAWKAMGYHGD
jgi:predicted dehydrogenase